MFSSFFHKYFSYRNTMRYFFFFFPPFVFCMFTSSFFLCLFSYATYVVFLPSLLLILTSSYHFVHLAFGYSSVTFQTLFETIRFQLVSCYFTNSDFNSHSAFSIFSHTVRFHHAIICLVCYLQLLPGLYSLNCICTDLHI